VKKFFLVILATILLSFSALSILPDKFVFSNADDGVPEYTANKTGDYDDGAHLNATRYNKGIWVPSKGRWYEFGGYNSTGADSFTSYYGPEDDGWQIDTIAQPATFSWTGAFALDPLENYIVISGDSVSNAEARRFDIDSHSFDSYTDLPSGSYYYSTSFITWSNNKIHILGKDEGADRDDIDKHYTHDSTILTGAWATENVTGVDWDYPGRMYQYKRLRVGLTHYFFNSNYDNDGGTSYSNKYDETTGLFSNITDNRTALGDNNRLLLVFYDPYHWTGVTGDIFGVFSEFNTKMDGSIIGTYNVNTGAWSVYDSSVNFGTNTRASETDATGWQGFTYEGKIYMMNQLTSAAYSHLRSIIYSHGTDVPVVNTNTVDASGDNLTFGGQVIDIGSSNVNIVGFQVALSTNEYSVNITDNVSLASPASFSKFVTGTSLVLAAGGYYKFRALAVNNYGISYGADNYFTWLPTSGNVILTITGIAISGNTALITAALSGSSSGNVTTYGFSWGSYQLENTWTGNVVDGAVPVTFSKLLVDLAENSGYYVVAKALANGQWYYSALQSFQIGEGEVVVSIDLPVVETRVATNITASSFIARGEITNIGGATVTKRGFVYSLDSATDITTWTAITESGSFSVGEYSRLLTVNKPNITVYFAAVAWNTYGVSYGQKYYVTLSDGGGTDGTSGGTSDGIGDFSAWLKGLMKKLGMDNLLGHWMFMVLIIILLAIVFGGFIIATKDEVIRKVLAVTLGLIIFTVFGAFVFSGLLGIWAVTILVIVAVGLIIIVTGKLLQGGSVNG